jgi:hypothetical protein
VVGDQQQQRWLVEYDLPRAHPLLFALPWPVPDIRVEKRSRLGAWLKPVRGQGTGDADFDRAFVVKPTKLPVPAQLLPAPMRQGLLAQRVPPWQTVDNLLVIAYPQAPKQETIDSGAAPLLALVELLGIRGR